MIILRCGAEKTQPYKLWFKTDTDRYIISVKTNRGNIQTIDTINTIDYIYKTYT